MQKLAWIAALSIQTVAIPTFAGGVGSGGGGTLPVDPVPAYTVEYIAKNSKVFLRMFFNELESPSALSSDPILKAKLFSGKTTIHDVIKENGVYIADDKPCFDADGKPVDGSIYAPEKNKICISSFTISQKLPESEAFPQIFALLAHEFSHLVGTTEDEAVQLQRLTEIYMKDVNQRMDLDKIELIRTDLQMNYSTVYDVLKGVEDLLSSLEKLSKDERSQAIDDVLTKYESFMTASFNKFPFAIFSPSEEVTAVAFRTKLITALWKLRGDSSAGDANYWKKNYDEVFLGDKEIDLATWRKRHFNDTEPVQSLPGYKIRNISSDDDLKLELQDLQLEADALTKYANDTVYQNKP